MRATILVPVLVFASVLGGAPVAWGQDHDKPIPVPAGARVRLEVDPGERLLGEHVLLHFSVTNEGKEPFRVDYGGDYNSASRAIRFHVTAVHEDGSEAVDPDPNPFCTGGILGVHEVTPEGRFEQSISLHRYRRIEKPGTWTIRVRHDLGWEDAPSRPVPAAEARVRFRAPTPEEARKAVDAAIALGPGEDCFDGERPKPFADFGSFALPVYLPVLLERVRAGRTEVLPGLLAMASADATRGLVDLLLHADAKVALESAKALSARLPDPEREGVLAPDSPFRDGSAESLQSSLAPYWRAEFVRPCMAWALKFLESSDLETSRTAAFYFRCLASKEDLPVVLGVLTRLCDGEAAPEWESSGAGPGGSDELRRVLEVLRARGCTAPVKPATTGEGVFFLVALAKDGGFRPEGWEKTLEGLLRHRRPWVRAWAFASLPDSLPMMLEKPAEERFSDSDAQVRRVAVECAWMRPNTAFRSGVLRAMEMAGDALDMDRCFDAAWAVGSGPGALEIAARRIADPGPGDASLQCIVMWLVGNEGASCPRYNRYFADAAEAGRIRDRWIAFFRKHGPAIRDGRRFRFGDAEVTVDLFPEKFVIQVGSRVWPPGADIDDR